MTNETSINMYKRRNTYLYLLRMFVVRNIVNGANCRQIPFKVLFVCLVELMLNVPIKRIKRRNISILITCVRGS